jgi:hypothetical protein
MTVAAAIEQRCSSSPRRVISYLVDSISSLLVTSFSFRLWLRGAKEVLGLTLYREFEPTLSSALVFAVRRHRYQGAMLTFRVHRRF